MGEHKVVIGYLRKTQGFFMLDYGVGVTFLTGITATNEIIAKATMMVVLRRSKQASSVRLFANLIQSLFHASSFLPPFLVHLLSVHSGYAETIVSRALSLSPFVEEVYPLICNFSLLHVLQNTGIG